MAEPRAFYRSYVHNGRRAGQVKRLHVIREGDHRPGMQAWCGTSAGKVTNSEAIVLNALPFVPPTGLTWCGNCVIALARRANQDPPASTPPVGAEDVDRVVPRAL